VKLALDSNVIVAALRSPQGASRRLLRLLRQGRIEAVASVNMMIEYEEVLKRPEQLEVSRLTRQEVDLFLDGLAVLVSAVSPHFLWRPQLRDPDDEMVLDAAVSAHCDAIVTFNKRDFEPAAARFGIEVLTPGEAVRRIE
jgi:putative PIN family toxin of toxin-antitoxin system